MQDLPATVESAQALNLSTAVDSAQRRTSSPAILLTIAHGTQMLTYAEHHELLMRLQKDKCPMIPHVLHT